MGGLVVRGVLAGAVAGFVAGLFLLAIGEPLIEAALTYEEDTHAAEVFSREVQRAGLVAAATVYGLSIGGLFGLAFALIAPRLRSGSAWERSVRLALAIFLGLWLVPFLKYPSNPPGVGDPATSSDRTTLYLAMVAISVVITILAYLAARALEDRRVAGHVRMPLVVGGYVVAIALAWLVLPDFALTTAIPAALLWDTRLASLGGQALLWSVLGVAFGTLAQRMLGGSAQSTYGPT